MERAYTSCEINDLVLNAGGKLAMGGQIKSHVSKKSDLADKLARCQPFTK